MCGIVGNNISLESVSNGIKAMKRGHDGESAGSFGDAFYGFQRHRIVGLESGMQPISNGTQALLFNGELFCHLDHASDLGLTVDGDISDSEILFALIERHGIGVVEKLDMMGAGAFICLENSTLTLFRDWVGEMPLHYSISASKKWAFASTRAALIAASETDSLEIIDVPPGARVQIRLDNLDVQTTLMCDRAKEQIPITKHDAAIRVRELMEHACTNRFWDASQFAVMVSGGIDSTITLSLILNRYNGKKPIPIYTFHCKDEPITEATDIYHARRVAEYFGNRVEHRIVCVSREKIICSIAETAEALEDVRGKDFNIVTALYNRFIAEAMAKDGIKVAYIGEGADEALASYEPWGSYKTNEEDSGGIEFRRKMVQNLHKGVLLRTSKVMMHFGPIECRTFFLNRDVNNYLASLPPSIVRCDGARKGILIRAFNNTLPDYLLSRQKARPQDASGISKIILDHFGGLSI